MEDSLTKLSDQDQLILDTLPYVRGIARRFDQRSGLDLAEIGTIGLIKAVGNYDPRRNVKFRTYATSYIIGEIKHAIRDEGRLIRLPAWVQDTYNVIQVQIKKEPDLGEKQNWSELADRINQDEILKSQVSEHTIATVLELMERKWHFSFEEYKPLDREGEPRSLEELIGEEDPELLGLDKYSDIHQALDGLHPECLKLLKWKFVDKLTAREIACRFGCSTNYTIVNVNKVRRCVRRAMLSVIANELDKTICFNCGCQAFMKRWNRLGERDEKDKIKR